MEGASRQLAQREAAPARAERDEQNELPARDLLNPNFSQILVNDPEVAEEVREYLATNAPDKVDIVKESKAKDVFDDRASTA